MSFGGVFFGFLPFFSLVLRMRLQSVNVTKNQERLCGEELHFGPMTLSSYSIARVDCLQSTWCSHDPDPPGHHFWS